MRQIINFDSNLTISPALSQAHNDYLCQFSKTRRITLDPAKLNRPDPLREAVGLPLGKDGGYFVNFNSAFARDDESIVNYNQPPAGQPNLRSHWVPNKTGTKLIWDTEVDFSFIKTTEWLQYFIDHFLHPWGYKINGIIKWQGDDFSQGELNVVDSQISLSQKDQVENKSKEIVVAEGLTLGEAHLLVNAVKNCFQLQNVHYQNTSDATKKIVTWSNEPTASLLVAFGSGWKESRKSVLKNDEESSAIEERWAKAVKGPYQLVSFKGLGGSRYLYSASEEETNYKNNFPLAEHVGGGVDQYAFFEHCWSDIKYLLDRIKELEKK